MTQTRGMNWTRGDKPELMLTTYDPRFSHLIAHELFQSFVVTFKWFVWEMTAVELNTKVEKENLEIDDVKTNP
jgi:hypothetical protein